MEEGKRVPYTFHDITAGDACALAAWRYDGPYAFYDLGPESIADLLDPAQGYVVVRDAAGAIVGFCCFGASAQVPGGVVAGVYADDALDVGFGLRPDLTGRGLGPAFVRATLGFARDRCGPRAFRLSVATFNRRAIRAYGKAGFRPGRCFLSPVRGIPTHFMVMTCDVPAGSPGTAGTGEC